MCDPLIDILMATYNGERFIGEQIESIQGQTYQNWRLLVSDDCSCDATLDVVRRYAAEDSRIRIVSEGVRYGGAKENFFALMRKADASYVMFCDQDDVWRSDKIAVEISVLLDSEARYGSSRPIMAHSNLALIDGDGRNLGLTMRDLIVDVDMRFASPAQLMFTNVAAGCTMVMNRSCLDESLKANCLDSVYMHDWWVTLVACMLGRRVYIDESLVFYRQHENNVVGALKKTPAIVTAQKYASIIIGQGSGAIGDTLAQAELGFIHQAQEFRRIYRSRAKAEVIDSIDSVCDLVELSLLQRLVVLNKYQLWRGGAKRKLRQLLAIVCLRRSLKSSPAL